MGVTNPYNDVTGALGIWGDVTSRTPAGDVKAGATGARIAANEGWLPASWGAGAGAALGGLEVVQGIERGGVGGYGEAAIGAGRIGLASGAIEAGSTAGQAIPLLGAGLGVYNFAKNWRSGATGSDALSGAETGASIGALGGPIGSLIGLGVGAAVGAVSSLFGPGKTDAENIGWDQYASAYQKGGAAAVAGASPSQNFQMIAGIFDSRGSNIPFYGKYGRMGENKFFADMTGQINQAIASKKIPPNASAAQIYSQVVEPWITAMGGKGGWQNTNTSKGAPEKQAVGNVLTSLISQYQSGQITSTTPLGISGQTVPIHPYAGTTPTATAHTASNKSPAAVSSATGASMPAVRPYQTYTPGVGGVGFEDPGLGYQQYPTGQPPAVGTGGSTSPTGTASPGTSPVMDLFGPPTPGDPLSGLGTFGILEGLGIYGESQAAKQTQGIIGPAQQAGSFFTGAGENLLSTAGQLTPLQQQALSTAKGQGTALINAATPVGQIAQADFQAYQSGNLKPGDQAQLDAQVASAKAQLAQALGPNVDSTTAATYMAEIDNQALMTKQSMLNSYFATGNQAFDTWASTTEAGQATITAGYNQAVQSVDQNFANAFGAAQVGSSFMLTAIEQALQSDSNLASALSNYTGNLAKAYALAKGAGAAGAAAGGGGATDTGVVSPIQEQSMSDWNTYNLASAYGGNTDFQTAVSSDPGYQSALGGFSSGINTFSGPSGSIDFGSFADIPGYN